MNARLEILEAAMSEAASDVTVCAGQRVCHRIEGTVVFGETITEAVFGELGQLAFGPSRLNGESKLLKYGGRRFRCTQYAADDGWTLEFRLLPAALPSLEALQLPPAVLSLLEGNHGLLIVTGPTGSGKSTTLAGLVGYLNENLGLKIETLEDPIEFGHVSRKSQIKQREKGRDFGSFDQAIIEAMRHDPDVIMVGEMREVSAIRAALTAAETGHLVLGTMHSPTASRAIARITDATQSSEVREQLAGALRAVLAQQLVAKSGGGRCAAFELLINNTATANAIRSNRLDHLEDEIGRGTGAGMISMDQSLERLARGRTISKEVAVAAAIKPEFLTKALSHVA